MEVYEAVFTNKDSTKKQGKATKAQKKSCAFVMPLLCSNGTARMSEGCLNFLA
jgi:hypothetical protein